MKIEDRINTLEGVEKSIWNKDNTLTVYYDESISLRDIQVKILTSIRDAELLRAIDKVKFLSTEKGTFIKELERKV